MLLWWLLYRSSIESLLRLLVVLLLELLRDRRHRRRGASLEGLLLGSTCLEGLLQGSRLAREAGELGLQLAGSLRLRLLQARIAGVLVLKRLLLLLLTEAGGLRSEGARLLLLLLAKTGGLRSKGAGLLLLLLLLLLLAWLAERASSILLRLTRAEAVSAHEGIGL